MLNRRSVVAALALSPVSLHAGELIAHDFAFPGIDGGLVRLADHAGGPILVVNTASRCGFTHQYDALQTLWESYREAGLTVIAVPSDDFNQELATEAEVKEFCAVNFALDFPMTAITPVKGAGAHPFYAWARSELGPENAPGWNFHKYLVDADGRLVGAYPSRVEPLSPTLVGAVEAALGGRQRAG